MSCGLICYLRMWRQLFTVTCWSIAGLSGLWRQCLGCLIGHCPKKKNQKINKPKIQKSKNLWSIIVQSIDPSFVLGEPHFVVFFSFTFSVHSRGPTFCWGSPILYCFIFICSQVSSPSIQCCSGGTLFCTIFLLFCWGRLVRNLTYQFVSGEENKIKTALFCVVDFLEVNCSSWRLNRKKKENSSG